MPTEEKNSMQALFYNSLAKRPLPGNIVPGKGFFCVSQQQWLPSESGFNI